MHGEDKTEPNKGPSRVGPSHSDLFNFNPITPGFFDKFNFGNDSSIHFDEDMMDGLLDEDWDSPSETKGEPLLNQHLYEDPSLSFSMNTQQKTVLRPNITHKHQEQPQNPQQSSIRQQSTISLLSDRVKEQEHDILHLRGVNESLHLRLKEQTENHNISMSQNTALKDKLESTFKQLNKQTEKHLSDHDSLQSQINKLQEQLLEAKTENEILRSQHESDLQEIHHLRHQKEDFQKDIERLKTLLADEADRISQLRQTDSNAVGQRYREEMERMRKHYQADIDKLEKELFEKDDALREMQQEFIKELQPHTTHFLDGPRQEQSHHLVIEPDEEESLHLPDQAVPSTINTSTDTDDLTYSHPTAPTADTDRLQQELTLIQQEHTRLLQQHQQLLNRTDAASTKKHVEFAEKLDRLWDSLLNSIGSVGVAPGDGPIMGELAYVFEKESRTSSNELTQEEAQLEGYAGWLQSMMRHRPAEERISQAAHVLLELHKRRLMEMEEKYNKDKERTQTSFQQVIKTEMERHEVELQKVKSDFSSKMDTAPRWPSRPEEDSDSLHSERPRSSTQPSYAEIETQLAEARIQQINTQRKLADLQNKLEEQELGKEEAIRRAVRECEKHLSALNAKKLESRLETLKDEIHTEYQHNMAKMKAEFTATMQDKEKNVSLLEKGYEDKFYKGKMRYKKKAEDMIYQYKKDAAKANRMLQLQRIRHHETMGMFMEDLRESLNRTIETVIVQKDDEIAQLEIDRVHEREVLQAEMEQRINDSRKQAVEETKKKQKKQYEKQIEKEKAKMTQQHQQELKRLQGTFQKYGKPS